MRLARLVCSAAVALALLLGAGGSLPIELVGAQEATEVVPLDPAQTEPVAADDGFDWGWIGLLGLIGLAGLMRRPERTATPVDRTTTTRPPGADVP